jgi:hypothetical protein
MKPLWRTSIILTAIAGAIITAILIFQRTNQPSIAFTEEWIATQVADDAREAKSFAVSVPVRGFGQWKL